MLTCHFCTAQLNHSMNDTYLQVFMWLGSTKTSRSKTDLSILPICINTHGQYTTPTFPKCAYKISQIFSRVFKFALAEKPRNPRKLMYREYFRVYSNVKCSVWTYKCVVGIVQIINAKDKRRLAKLNFLYEKKKHWQN